MSRLRDAAQRHAFDILIVLAALASAVEVAVTGSGPRSPQTTHWFAVPAVAVIVLPLLARRRFPFAAPAALWVAAAAVSFVDGRLVTTTQVLFIAGFCAAFLLGNVREPRAARIGLAIVLAGAAVVVSNDPERGGGEIVFIPIFFAIGWLLGYALQERAAQAEAAEARASEAERDRENAARLAVAEERARIARELHDIVAHAMSVIVLQVGVVRHRLPDGLEEDRAALEDVERTGRAALTEMRRLVGATRGERDELELTPQPGLGSLDSLLDEVRRAGLAVDLQVEGEPIALPQAIDLSAYRIVQEGLTNTLKHANASSAHVIVRYGRDELQIDVRDDGDGPAQSDGLGHGLIGIRERVKLYGGEMTVDAANGHGFVLSTRLPLARARP